MALVEFNNDSTPYLNAENINNNFNELKNNYNELNNNFNELRGTILYDVATGSNESITLSDSAANYNYLEIYFMAEEVYNSIKIASPNYKKVNLEINISFGSSNYYKVSKYIISNNSILLQTSTEYAVSTSGISGVTDNPKKVYIVKVVGYK